ncbi:hypothetical protein LNKW23_24710 [Paralimibaculum aggregatum]|uniref:Tetratricopeptide repeat protein n=1 Tax=Paralimibaculum aggregatum TaxID=3036245 RepID=A0ABQ6LQC7_9RHOB|nr:tetratricopeptide repeat protein [Limibaculum sp. NKW23]GMG83258.1 hypothetical protein LNKW23_24710 [Limibaculum sp. NKW23]
MTQTASLLIHRSAYRRYGAIVRGLILGLICAFALAACDSVEERAEKHYQNGIELLEQDQAVKASLEFRNAIKLNDNHVGANLELGKYYEQQDNFSAAVFQYRKVISLDASQLDAHLRLAQIMLAFNETEPALTSTVAAAQLAPDDVRVVTLEAVVAMRVGEMEKAKAKADRALELDPDNGDAWIVLAAISRREDDSEKALEQTLEGERVEPDNIRVQLFKLNLLSELKREAELGETLKRLTELDPEELSFWDSLARWQLRNNKAAEAEASLRRISELAPDDTDRQLDLVRMVIATEGAEAGIAELKRLIELRKDSPAVGTLELAMVDVEIQQDKFDDAERRLKRLLVTMENDEEVLQTARLGLARLAISRNDNAAAATLIDEVLATDPTHAKALTLRGRLQIEAEDYDAAIRDLRAAEAEAPEDLETIRLLAVAYERNGSKDLAAERKAKAVQVSDHAVSPVLDYASHLMGEGRMEVAEGVITDALSKRRGEIRLVEALARVKLRRRDYKGVERIAEALGENEETSELADRLMAAALAGQKRYDETIRLLEASSAESGGGRSSYLAALVATHLRNDDLEAAKAVVDEALAENPAASGAIRLKGTLAMVEGDTDAAGRMFREAVAADPTQPMNHLALFRYHLLKGEREVAEKALQLGIEETDNNTLRLNNAMLLEQTGRIDAAIAEYQVLFDRQPDSEVIANNLASLMTDNNPSEEQIDRAFVIAKRLRDTEVPHFQDTYGWLMFLRGDARGARDVLEQAAKKLPNNPIVQYHLGVVLAETGDTEGARVRLSRAIELAGEREVPQIAGAQARLDSLEPKPAAE